MNTMKKILFIDRDGTLIEEPKCEQVDSLEKLTLVPQVIPSLLTFVKMGWRFVMITNQDGLGTPSFPQAKFHQVQDKLLAIFRSQGIVFDDILICPHKEEEGCHCRKPHLLLVTSYLKDPTIDWQHSYVIGDRASDLALARHMKIEGCCIKSHKSPEDVPHYSWPQLVDYLIHKPRTARVHRVTKETDIELMVNLDGTRGSKIATGIPFFDHMLEQIVTHGKIGLQLRAQGDIQVDHHHLIEDTALALGEGLRQALGDKFYIHRYGFFVPMDEAAAHVLLDLSGRPYFVFQGNDLIKQGYVAHIDVQMFEHFFRSLTTTLLCNLHMTVTGTNSHHMVEALFKSFARSLAMATQRQKVAPLDLTHDKSDGLPSSKGQL